MYGIPLILTVFMGGFLLVGGWSLLSRISWAWVIGVPTTLMLLVVSAVLNGWVIACLWDWFIVPMGAPHMPITSALGLAMIFQVLIEQQQKGDTDKIQEHESIAGFLTATFIGVFTSRLIILVMGWVVTWFQ